MPSLAERTFTREDSSASSSSCANAGAPNHASGDVNALYADGSVRTLSPELEIEADRLPAGTTTIPVGPGSPLADLAKLRVE